MSQKLVRLPGGSSLNVRLTPYISQSADVICSDHRVFHVKIRKVDSDYLYGINLRGKKVRYPVNNIKEIILQSR
jgi:hypothetical protein